MTRSRFRSASALSVLALLLAVTAAAAAQEGPDIRITDYEFKEYRRHPRMEEQDRLTGRSFVWSSGLEIITDVYDVEVRLFEETAGRTPWEVDGLAAGAYRVRLERSGYQSVEFWVTLSRDRRTVVEVTMGRPAGTISLRGLPPGARVTLDRKSVDGTELSAAGGRHSLSVTAFGWEPVQVNLDVPPGGILEWRYGGGMVRFAFNGIRVRPASLPPGDVRGFEVDWSATAAGSAVLRVISPSGVPAAVIPFDVDAPSGRLHWVPSGPGGEYPADGGYRVMVEGTGEDGVSSVMEAPAVLDSRFRRSVRSSAATSLPGLLYAPGTAMLPRGIWQISTGTGWFTGTGDSPVEGGVPLRASFRISPAPRWEIRSAFGVTVQDPFDTTSLDLAASGSFRISGGSGPFTLNTALLFFYEGYAVRFGHLPAGRPGTALPGLQLAFPMELALSPDWHLVASPSLHLTFLGDDSGSRSFAGPARTAAGLGLGGYWESEGNLAGASVALRSPDLPGGLLDWHLWCGLESRLSLPGDASCLTIHAGVRLLSGDPVIDSGVEFGLLR